jgi:hypothetical protein
MAHSLRGMTSCVSSKKYSSETSAEFSRGGLRWYRRVCSCPRQRLVYKPTRIDYYMFPNMVHTGSRLNVPKILAAFPGLKSPYNLAGWFADGAVGLINIVVWRDVFLFFLGIQSYLQFPVSLFQILSSHPQIRVRRRQSVGMWIRRRRPSAHV